MKTNNLIFGLIAALGVGFALYSSLFNDFDKKNVSSAEGYTFGDNLSCEIIHSTIKSGNNKKISLINLNTEEPKLLPLRPFS